MDISRLDLWTLIICGVRYAMRRRSYMPSLVCEIFRRHSEHLTGQQVRQIRDEVAEGLRVDAEHPGYMGSPCDVDEWRRLVAWIDSERPNA